MSILGKLLYRLYYQRKNQEAVVKKFGGKKNYLKMQAAEDEMRHYALNNLSTRSDFSDQGKFKINFLTGEKFIHQTLFCTYTFLRFLTKEEAKKFSINYYSDGTLTSSTARIIAARFPQIKVISFEETTKAIQECLPPSSYPYLRKKVETLPLFKKLVYPHLNCIGLSLFFDSDMLFLKRPNNLLNWLYQHGDDSDAAFCIQDVERSYGYTDQEILSVWPNPIKTDINSGLYAIWSEKIEFSFVEQLIKDFETRFGSQYYLEQLITAIILERSANLTVAAKTDYVVLPSVEQIKEQSGILHHYVNQSKEYYFKESWKRQLD